MRKKHLAYIIITLLLFCLPVFGEDDPSSKEGTPPEISEPNSSDATGEIEPPQSDDQPGNQPGEPETSEKPDGSDEADSNEPVEIERPPAPTLKICNCRYTTDVPYRDRRSRWGGFVGVMAGAFSPVNYQPSYSPLTYQNFYTGAQGPNVELVFGAKYNFVLGSLEARLTGGFFSTTVTTATLTATLNVEPVTAGLVYELNTIFKEPYVVPYVEFGAYTDFFKETQQGLLNGAPTGGGQTTNGTGPIGTFYAVGGMFQLDWIDQETHNNAYEDYGIENTYLFVEARSFLTAPVTTASSSNFSTPLQISGGLMVEF